MKEYVTVMLTQMHHPLTHIRDYIKCTSMEDLVLKNANINDNVYFECHVNLANNK
jgi:hypothetical protein